MSTIAPHHVAHLDEQHAERRRLLHDERQFRVEQLRALEADPAFSSWHESVNQTLRTAAIATLREIDAALERMNQGSYGLCVQCSQPLPASRLDTIPRAPLCMPCHYTEQNCRPTPGRT